MMTYKRFQFLLALFVGVGLFAATVADAQDEKKQDGQRRREGQRQGQRRGGFSFFGGGGLRGGGFGLLRNPAVQKELKLTEEQNEQIRELSESQRKETRELYSGLGELSREERQKKFAELRPKMEEINKEMEEVMGEVLEDAQSKRLGEIRLQLQGPRAIASPDLAKKLNLTEEQQKQITELLTGTRNKGSQLYKDFQDKKITREEMQEQFQALRKEGEENVKKAAEVLTEEQKATLTKLKGEKFDMPRPQFGRGGAASGIRVFRRGEGRDGKPEEKKE